MRHCRPSGFLARRGRLRVPCVTGCETTLRRLRTLCVQTPFKLPFPSSVESVSPSKRLYCATAGQSRPGSRIIGSARRGKCEEFRSHLPRHPLSLRQASEGSSEDPAPKPRSLACFERRKPPLGAVFLVFDLRRASLGVGQGRNKAAPTAVRAGAPGRARALSSSNT